MCITFCGTFFGWHFEYITVLWLEKFFWKIKIDKNLTQKLKLKHNHKVLFHLKEGFIIFFSLKILWNFYSTSFKICFKNCKFCVGYIRNGNWWCIEIVNFVHFRSFFFRMKKCTCLQRTVAVEVTVNGLITKRC